GRVDVSAALRLAAAVTFSGHKLGAPKGGAVLVLRRRAQAAFTALLVGGGHERGLRAGTPSPALAAATARAVTLAALERAARARAMLAERSAFLEGVAACAPRVVTPLANALPNTVMLGFPAVDGRLLLPALDLAGVAASHG